MVVAALATVLPWTSVAGVSDAASESTLGISTGEGQLLILVMVVGIAATQAGYRPAWIAAGLGAVVAIGQVIELLGDDGVSPGVGLWISAIASAAAAAMLVTDLVLGVRSGRPGATG